MQKLYTEDIPSDVTIKGNIIISSRKDDVNETLRQYLHGEGYGVYICKSFEEFMQLEHVDLMCIVIDVAPGYSSTFHSIEIIKQSPIGEQVPIMVVADVNSTENVVRALNAGASDYLLHPYSKREFLNRVLSLVSSNRE